MWLKPFLIKNNFNRQLGIAIPSGKADGKKFSNNQISKEYCRSLQ